MKEKKKFYSSEFLKAEYLGEEEVILCTALKDYIPDKEFKYAFGKFADFIRKQKVKVFIFDKSEMDVFNQSSMSWYHVVWKRDLLSAGLKCHYKILPKNDFFRESVKIGRKRIEKENPNFNFDDFQIEYFESIEKALEAACKE